MSVIPTKPTSNGVNVLYLDDEQSNLEVFKSLVRRDGYNIYTTTSTKEAFKILKANEIHIVLSDQRMKGTTGVEFFESIIKDYPKPIRILTTAYSDFDTVIDAINKGQVYKYLCKPWENGCIRAALIQSYEVYCLREHNEKLLTDLQKYNTELIGINGKLEFMLHQKESFNE